MGKRPKLLSFISPHGIWLFHSVKPFVIKPSVKRPKLLSFISPHGMKKLLFLFLFAIQVCAVFYNKYLLPLFSLLVLNKFLSVFYCKFIKKRKDKEKEKKKKKK